MVLAHTYNKEGNKAPFLLLFTFSPQKRVTVNVCIKWDISPFTKYFSLYKISQNHHFPKCTELNLPWSLRNWKENTYLSPNAKFSGVLCMVKNLLRMLASGLGCPELLNYCDLSSGRANNCALECGLWHISQKERSLDIVFQQKRKSSFNICRWK